MTQTRVASAASLRVVMISAMRSTSVPRTTLYGNDVRMIVVAPPQHSTPAQTLRYVLVCPDGACFVLSITEAIRTQRECHVPFLPWSDVEDIDKARALSAVRQEQALERRLADAVA